MFGFVLKPAIGWETAKKYYYEDVGRVYYDTKDYSQIAWTSNDVDLSEQYNKLYGGYWKSLDITDVRMLDDIHGNLSTCQLTSNPWDEPESELQYDPNSVKFREPILTTFPERLRMFQSEFYDLLVVKNKAYGNSALEPINTFSKASSSDVILQQIDHKLSRIKNSEFPIKNDVIDLMGYLTLYCLDQSWLDLRDLYS